MIAPSKTFIAVFSVASLLALGCAGKSSSEEESNQSVEALEAENGGMTTANEAPQFADDKFSQVQDVVEMPEYDAQLPSSPDQVINAPGARVYTIALMWGHLPAAHDAEDADVDPKPIDWTGSVSVDAGAIKVQKAIKFDKRDAVTPRTDVKSVAFVSHTLPHVDGLFLTVAVPATAGTTLHFESNALKTDIDLAQMAVRGGGVERLDDGRNGLAFIGFQNEKDCARGLMFGRWHKKHKAFGVFRGRVVDGQADVIGHVRGIWGHAPRRNADLFFGKYISTDGQTRGLFGGTYGGGEARGVWATRDPKDVGGLQLWYSDGYEENDGRGVWLGRWSERCAAR